MDPNNLKAIEEQRQALLDQLRAADAALRAGLQTRGFGSTAHGHMERALAHVQEAVTAINDINRARTVTQLVTDLVRMQHVMNTAQQGKSQRI